MEDEKGKIHIKKSSCCGKRYKKVYNIKNIRKNLSQLNEDKKIFVEKYFHEIHKTICKYEELKNKNIESIHKFFPKLQTEDQIKIDKLFHKIHKHIDLIEMHPSHCCKHPKEKQQKEQSNTIGNKYIDSINCILCDNHIDFRLKSIKELKEKSHYLTEITKDLSKEDKEDINRMINHQKVKNMEEQNHKKVLYKLGQVYKNLKRLPQSKQQDIAEKLRAIHDKLEITFLPLDQLDSKKEIKRVYKSRENKKKIKQISNEEIYELKLEIKTIKKLLKEIRNEDRLLKQVDIKEIIDNYKKLSTEKKQNVLELFNEIKKISKPEE